ncbi:hypothetical protein K1719_034831 [Acacia pycnantha]|nr:hypothetical protein K1719_034831 [Acacia pycnantha]
MNHHDQLEISVEENEIRSWRERCNCKIESLKARDQSSYSTDQDHQRSSVLIFELLQEALHQNGNVDQFIDVLENNISSSSSSSSSPSSLSLGLSEIFDEVSPSGDSLLHDAVFYGREEIAEIISHHFPQLLTKKDVYGNTPLHVASARTNNSSIMMIRVLLSEYGSNNETELTRVTNEYGNTALHEALYGKNLLGADVLFDADKSVAHYLNNSMVSPFYLAVQRSYGELVGRWLEAEGVFAENMDLSRSHGISPLHAAISTKNAGN